MGSSLWARPSPPLPPTLKPGNKDFPLLCTPPLPPPGPSSWGRPPSGPREEASSSIVLCGPAAAGRGHVVPCWSRARPLGQVVSALRGCFLVIKRGPHEVLRRQERKGSQGSCVQHPAPLYPPHRLRLLPTSLPNRPDGRCQHMFWLGRPFLAGLITHGSHTVGGSAKPNPEESSALLQQSFC